MIAADQASAAMLIRSALAERGLGKTICPSEIARQLAGASGDWRGRMAEVHAAVDVLASAREIELTWKGRPMPERQGPYRIGSPE